jgi:hypothetical protein
MTSAELSVAFFLQIGAINDAAAWCVFAVVLAAGWWWR